MKRIATVLLLASLLGACSKIDLKHYDQLSIGMSQDEVTTLLGKADQCDDLLGTRQCRWGEEGRNIKVQFLAGKAVLFSAAGLE